MIVTRVDFALDVQSFCCVVRMDECLLAPTCCAQIAICCNHYKDCLIAYMQQLTACHSQVQVDKDRKLIISGERKKEETQMDVKWRQKTMERCFGAFQRKFQLPEDADVNKIKGKAENGILSITISKIPKEDVPSDSTSIPIY